MHEFNPDNVLRVEIDRVKPNGWNPKLEDTEEYSKVVESIQVNGFKQPILVREVENGYEVVDGEQRWRACKELGLKEIYVYNLGDVSEKEAKSLTLWTQVQVPLSEIQLAPLIVELNELGKAIPYSDEEIEDFTNMLNFDFVSTVEDDGLVDWKVKVTPEQKEHIMEMLTECVKEEAVDEAEALVKMMEKGAKHYGI